MSRQRVTGIVLAGGRSTRFGGDKLAATIDGRPLPEPTPTRTATTHTPARRTT